MKDEQKVTIIYLLLGLLNGVLSKYLVDLIFSVSVPVVVYVLSIFVMYRFLKGKKLKWLISNSFITFMLIWLLTWIVLYNLS